MSTASVTVDNTAPVVDSVSISPSTGIDSTTLLTCSYTASDVDGDAVTASYSWVNLSTNTTYPSTASTLQLTPTNSEPSNIIECSVTVTDSNGGSDNDSASVTVENTLPYFTANATIASSSNTVGDVLICSAAGMDQDDGSLTPVYSWSTGATGSSYMISASDVNVGDTITCTATITDSLGETATSSDSVIVANTAPVLSNIVINPNGTVTNSDTLTCSVTVTDPDETLTPIFTWSIGGVSTATGATLDLSSTSAMPNDVVLCEASVVDASSATDSASTTVTIVNRAPVLSAVTISPSSSITTSSTLSCAASVTDADGKA